jgi:hypothetical protein
MPGARDHLPPRRTLHAGSSDHRPILLDLEVTEAAAAQHAPGALMRRARVANAQNLLYGKIARLYIEARLGDRERK